MARRGGASAVDMLRGHYQFGPGNTDGGDWPAGAVGYTSTMRGSSAEPLTPIARTPIARAAVMSLLAALPLGLAATPAHAETFAEASARGAGAAFLFALTAGLLTALTPCVYPMIPITVSIFGAKTGTSRARAFVLATFYVSGIAVMFGSLG